MNINISISNVNDNINAPGPQFILSFASYSITNIALPIAYYGNAFSAFCGTKVKGFDAAIKRFSALYSMNQRHKFIRSYVSYAAVKIRGRTKRLA